MSDKAEGGASALAVALKQFAATLQRHSDRQTTAADVFASALREINHELQKTKGRARALETRLEEAEGRIQHLERLVAALTRQGWVH